MWQRLRQPRSVQRLSGSFSQIKAPVVFPTAAPNVEPREDIWPTDPAVVVRRRDEGVELVQLRWGFPPAQRRNR